MRPDFYRERLWEVKRRVTVEIDLGRLSGNYKKILRRVRPARVLAVVKADAYGMGLEDYLKTLIGAGCRDFGVADPFEALEAKKILRSLGSKASLSVLSSVLPDEIEAMVRAGVVLPVADLKTAKLISAAAISSKKKAKINFKVDTGMGRLGMALDSAIAIMQAASKLANVEVEGIMSHCPAAGGSDDDYTKEQIERFRNLIFLARGKGIKFKCAHIAASDAINSFPSSYSDPFNMVRAGIDLHGAFDPSAQAALGLKSVFTLKSRIAQVRTMPEGSTVGYDRTWKAVSPAKVAVIAAGYADGLPLALSNRGSVIVKGRLCPIIGRVSMDYAAVDVTRIGSVRVGDEAILLGGNSKVSIMPQDWAKLKGTHVYDIICSFGNRVERKIKKGGGLR